MGKSDAGENMIVAGLDQDWAEKVAGYNQLTSVERGQLALWLTEHSENIGDAPEWVRAWVISLASTAFLETGMRWAMRYGEEG